jgi:hypothetical protein
MLDIESNPRNSTMGAGGPLAAFSYPTDGCAAEAVTEYPSQGSSCWFSHPVCLQGIL